MPPSFSQDNQDLLFYTTFQYALHISSEQDLPRNIFAERFMLTPSLLICRGKFLSDFAQGRSHISKGFHLLIGLPHFSGKESRILETRHHFC